MEDRVWGTTGGLRLGPGWLEDAVEPDCGCLDGWLPDPRPDLTVWGTDRTHLLVLSLPMWPLTGSLAWEWVPRPPGTLGLEEDFGEQVVLFLFRGRMVRGESEGLTDFLIGLDTLVSLDALASTVTLGFPGLGSKIGLGGGRTVFVSLVAGLDG